MISSNFFRIKRKDRLKSTDILADSNKSIDIVIDPDANKYTNNWLHNSSKIVRSIEKQENLWKEENKEDELNRIETTDLFELIDEEVHAQTITDFNSNGSKLISEKKNTNSIFASR